MNYENGNDSESLPFTYLARSTRGRHLFHDTEAGWAKKKNKETAHSFTFILTGNPRITNQLPRGSVRTLQLLHINSVLASNSFMIQKFIKHSTQREACTVRGQKSWSVTIYYRSSVMNRINPTLYIHTSTHLSHVPSTALYYDIQCHDSMEHVLLHCPALQSTSLPQYRHRIGLAPVRRWD